MRKHLKSYVRSKDTKVYAYYLMDKKQLFYNLNFAGDKILKIKYVKD